MSTSSFCCPICGNTDPHFIGVRNGTLYCRKCIGFKGAQVPNLESFPKSAKIILKYDLSFDQKALSEKLIENYKSGIDSLVSAVCGAGKTEIVLATISYAIQCGEHVGFAIPRRDVVREIAERLQQIFTSNSVISVYGGHNTLLDADIVCLTTHQLYHYDHHFDLLIMDEIDAFPFKGNDVLKQMFFRALKGHYILMSATADDSLLDEFRSEGKSLLRLDSRFHHHPLPVPEMLIRQKPFGFLALCQTLDLFIKANLPVFVFCPTIEDCENTYFLLRFSYKNGNYVHSKRTKRPEIINDFRKGKYRFLVTTSILERGVTVKNLQVIVYHADHDIYNAATLIQISGRAGRKADAPEGKVIFIGNEITKSMRNAVEEINRANKSLQDMLCAHQEQLSLRNRS